MALRSDCSHSACSHSLAAVGRAQFRSSFDSRVIGTVTRRRRIQVLGTSSSVGGDTGSSVHRRLRTLCTAASRFGRLARGH